MLRVYHVVINCTYSLPLKYDPEQQERALTRQFIVEAASADAADSIAVGLALRTAMKGLTWVKFKALRREALKLPSEL